MDVILCGPHGNARIMARRRDVHLLERRITCDFPLATLFCATPLQCRRGPAREFMKPGQGVENDMLTMTLD